MSSRRRSPARRSKSVRRGGSRRRSAGWCCPRATTPSLLSAHCKMGRDPRGTTCDAPVSSRAITLVVLEDDRAVLHKDRCMSGTGARRDARGGQNSARVRLGARGTRALGEYPRISGHGPGVCAGAGRSRHHRTRRSSMASPPRDLARQAVPHPHPSLATWQSGLQISARTLAGEIVVEPAAVSPFAAWESFYVIIGSSGAALTGLQFVVIALSAEGRATRTAQ